MNDLPSACCDVVVTCDNVGFTFPFEPDPASVELDDTNILDESTLSIGFPRPPDMDGLPGRDWIAWPYARQITLPANAFSVSPSAGGDGRTVTVTIPNHDLRAQYDWRGFTGTNGVKEYVHFHDPANTYDQSIIFGTVGQVTLADPFTTTLGSDLVVVNWPNHGGKTGWSVKIAGATAVNGISMPDGYYRIDSVINTSSFRIDRGIVATGAGAGGGPAVTMSISDLNTIIYGQYEVASVIDASTITVRRSKAVTSEAIGGSATAKATIWTDQADLFFEKGHKVGSSVYLPAWVKDDITDGAVSIIRKPKIPIQAGVVYDVSMVVAGCIGGSARFFFDTVPGDGDEAAAAAAAADGVHLSTIDGGADGASYVRIEMSNTFVGELRSEGDPRGISVRPQKQFLLIENAAYLVSPADAYGDWAGQTGKIAVARRDDAGVLGWTFRTPRLGQRVWVKRLKCNKFFTGTTWVQEHPAIIGDFDSAYDRDLRPPYDVASADAGTPWAYPVPWKGLAIKGALAVFSAGGFQFDEPMLGMQLYVRDVRPAGTNAGQGMAAGGGFRRTSVEQAIEINTPMDTGEVLFTSYWADKRGKIIEWRAATTGYVGRIIWQYIGKHPISGKNIHQGKFAEIVGSYVPGGGGELLFRMSPGGQPNSAISHTIRMVGSTRFSEGHSPLDFWFSDLSSGAGMYKRVDFMTLEAMMDAAGVVMVDPPDAILQKRFLYMDA